MHISPFLPYPVILLTMQTEHFVTLDCQHYCHNVSFFFFFSICEVTSLLCTTELLSNLQGVWDIHLKIHSLNMRQAITRKCL